jgi:wyosine [tRNA(Phe)-imidazoG37] synthetase (radical SAM superfamily)
MIAFGPIPSRRLGFSLGINHIPPKYCSYACVYCQVGRTSPLTIKRRPFFSIEQITAEIKRKIEKCASLNQTIDFLTFVPDGEPTLDLNLEQEIQALQVFHIPIAVITNASLLTIAPVRSALHLADWVSVKVDTVHHETWRKINRPHGYLRLDDVLHSIRRFSAEYAGVLVTETMLVQGINDSSQEMNNLAAFLSQLQPQTAYLSAPIRPPVEKWVTPPNPETVNCAFQTLSKRIRQVKLLTTPEENRFSVTGKLADDLMNITAVHPLREDVVLELVRISGEPWEIVEELIEKGILQRVVYENKHFFIQRFHP